MKFAKDQYKYDEKTEQSLNAHVFKSHNIQKITKQRLIPMDKISIKSYYNSIKVLAERIYLLSITSDNRGSTEDYVILEGEILQWEYQLDYKFESKNDLKSQFQTLEICLSIFQGKNQSFGEISTFKKDIQAYIARKVKESFGKYLLNLINYQIKKIEKQIPLLIDISEKNVREVLVLVGENVLDVIKEDNVMMRYMKYLIFTDNARYMFLDFLDTFKHIQNLKYIFYQSLEPFIILGFIKFIPSEEIYSTFFNYYDTLQKSNIISKLIFNLDAKQQGDFSYIKRSCNQLKYLSAFIYISTRLEDNFKSPLQQMISDYESFDYKQPKTQTDKISTNRQYTQEWIGYKLLWYIKRTLSGLVYPNQQMEENQWSEASNCIFEWIFFERNLIKLLKIDPDLALQNLLMFFRGYSSDLLKVKEQEYQSKFVRMLQNYKKDETPQNNGSKQQHQGSLKTLICKYIQFVLEQTDSDKYLPLDTWNYYFLLLAEVKDKDVKLDLDISTKAAFYLIENPNSHFYRNKDLAQEIEYKSRQIIKLIQPHIQKNKLNLNDFLKRALNSPFVEVCSYIYRLQEDFDSAIKIYLDASFIDIRFKVFSFIKEILETQSDKQSLLIEKIFSHLPKLISINHSQTKELLEKLQNFDIHAIFKALDSYDDLRFKILSEYITEYKRKIIEEQLSIPENETYLYHYYIKLLIKFQPSEVVNELKTQLYSLEAVEQILKEANHLQGIAYVLSCYGNIKGALEIHLKIIQKYQERKDKYHAQREFYEATELLMKTNKRGDEDCENNWFFWLSGIQKMEQRIPKEMIELQKKLEEDCFEALVHNVQIKSILQNKELLPILGQNAPDNLALNSKIYETLQTLLKSYTFELKIFEYSKDILYNEYCRRENISFKYAKKGIKINFSCSSCKRELNRDITHYLCSHSYCSDCAKNYCQVCYENKKNSCKNAFNQEEWKNLVVKYQQNLKLEEEQRLKEEKEKENGIKNKQVQEDQFKKIEEQKKSQELKLIKDRKLKKLKNFDRNISEQRQEVYNFES